jgi:hypothetical protein
VRTAKSQPAAPSPERAFWYELVRELRKDSTRRIEETAKQLIALVTLLSGIYFHAITYSQIPRVDAGLKVLFVGPLAVWAGSLLLAVLVLLPLPLSVTPRDPDEAKEVIEAALARKYWLLAASLALLVISLGWLVWAAWVYLDIYVVK